MFEILEPWRNSSWIYLSSHRKTLGLKVWHSAKRHALMLRVVLFIFMLCP